MRVCRWLVKAGLPLLALAGCGETTQRYAGPLTGEPPQPCPAARATLLVRDGAVKFVPDEGALVLDGKMEPDGAIRAAAERPGIGRDASGTRQPFRLGFEGRLVGGRIVGTYATPRCRGHVELSPS